MSMAPFAFCRVDSGSQGQRAALAAAAATGLAKLLVVGAADADTGLQHSDMVKVNGGSFLLGTDPAISYSTWGLARPCDSGR